MWQIFIGKLQAIITSCAPSKNFFRRKRCAWVDFRTTKQLKNRYRKWKRYKSTKKTCDFVEYKRARNAAIASLRKARHKFENKLASNITSSSAIAETARRTSYFDLQNCEVEFLSHRLGDLGER